MNATAAAVGLSAERNAFVLASTEPTTGPAASPSSSPTSSAASTSWNSTVIELHRTSVTFSILGGREGASAPPRVSRLFADGQAHAAGEQPHDESDHDQSHKSVAAERGHETGKVRHDRTEERQAAADQDRQHYGKRHEAHADIDKLRYY